MPSQRSDARAAARKALSELMEPLAAFALDSGLSTHELHSIFQEAAIRSVASRQLEAGRRVNMSGISASTGISRAEISRILKLVSQRRRQKVDRRQQTTNKILAAWYQDPKFTTSDGRPADLKIYGQGATFETLVKSHGRGIPTRATLDELAHTGAIRILSSQKIRAMTSVAIDGGVSTRAIKAFGDRSKALMTTMLQNMRHPDRPQLVANVENAEFPEDRLPLFRKELSTQGADFLARLHDNLFRETSRKPADSNSKSSNRVGVTVFYHENITEKLRKTTTAIRRNFKRVSR